MSKKSLLKNDSAYAVVEASFVFPVIILIFVMMIYIGMYVQAKVALQSAVQSAINMIAVEESDASVDVSSGAYMKRGGAYKNVYAKLFSSFSNGGNRGNLAKELIKKNEGKYILLAKKDLKKIEYKELNFIVYRECWLKATKEFKPPINLTWLGFPEVFEIKASAKAVIQDGDEFIRNTDIAVELGDKLLTRLGVKEKIGPVIEKIKKHKNKIKSFLSGL